VFISFKILLKIQITLDLTIGFTTAVMISNLDVIFHIIIHFSNIKINS